MIMINNNNNNNKKKKKKKRIQKNFVFQHEQKTVARKNVFLKNMTNM